MPGVNPPHLRSVSCAFNTFNKIAVLLGITGDNNTAPIRSASPAIYRTRPAASLSS